MYENKSIKNINAYKIKYDQLSVADKKAVYQEKCLQILQTVLTALEKIVAEQADIIERYKRIKDILDQTWSYIQVISTIDPNFSYIYLDLTNVDNRAIINQIWEIAKETLQAYNAQVKKDKEEDKNENEDVDEDENINGKIYHYLMYSLANTENLITYEHFPALDSSNEDDQLVWTKEHEIEYLITIADIKRPIKKDIILYLDPLTKVELTKQQLVHIQKVAPNFYKTYQQAIENKVQGTMPKELYELFVGIMQICASNTAVESKNFQQTLKNFLDQHPDIKNAYQCFEKSQKDNKAIIDDLANMRKQYDKADDVGLGKTLIRGFFYDYLFEFIQGLERQCPGIIAALKKIYIVGDNSFYDNFILYQKNECMGLISQTLAQFLYYMAPVDFIDIVNTGAIGQSASYKIPKNECGKYFFIVSDSLNPETIKTISTLINIDRKKPFNTKKYIKILFTIVGSGGLYLLFWFLDQFRNFIAILRDNFSNIITKMKELILKHIYPLYIEFFPWCFSERQSSEPFWSRPITILVIVLICFPCSLVVPVIYLLSIIINETLGLIGLLSSPSTFLDKLQDIGLGRWQAYIIMALSYLTLFFLVISVTPLVLFKMHLSTLPLLHINSLTIGSLLYHFIIQPFYSLLHLSSLSTLAIPFAGWAIVVISGLTVAYGWTCLIKSTVNYPVDLYFNKLAMAKKDIAVLFPKFELAAVSENNAPDNLLIGGLKFQPSAVSNTHPNNNYQPPSSTPEVNQKTNMNFSN